MASRTVKRIRDEKCCAQGGRCDYCGVRMTTGKANDFPGSSKLTPKQSAKVLCTAEHLRALKDGGKNNRENIVAACRTCNWRRHAHGKNYAEDEYRRLIHKRIAQGRWHADFVYRCGLIPADQSDWQKCRPHPDL